MTDSDGSAARPRRSARARRRVDARGTRAGHGAHRRSRPARIEHRPCAHRRAASTSPSTTRPPRSCASPSTTAPDAPPRGRRRRRSSSSPCRRMSPPRVIERELTRFPQAVVTDVASVKLEPLKALRERGVDLTHYIGSHPLAGRERGGAIAARADIFVGRPWVVCRDGETSAADLALVEAPRARPRRHAARDVARRSRPCRRSRLARPAARREPARRTVRRRTGRSLRLAGQGVRDTTRIAASAPELWVQILGANAAPVVDVLDALAARPVCRRRRAARTRSPRRAPDRRRHDPPRQRRRRRLPGKHGGQSRRFEQVVVMVDDTPGQLGRLFGELGELDVNVEDLRLEHSPGAQFGLAEISVVPSAVRRAVEGPRSPRLEDCEHHQ